MRYGNVVCMENVRYGNLTYMAGSVAPQCDIMPIGYTVPTGYTLPIGSSPNASRGDAENIAIHE